MSHIGTQRAFFRIIAVKARLSLSFRSKSTINDCREVLSGRLVIINTPFLRERVGLVVNASDSRSRGRGFEPHSGQTVFCP